MRSHGWVNGISWFGASFSSLLKGEGWKSLYNCECLGFPKILAVFNYASKLPTKFCEKFRPKIHILQKVMKEGLWLGLKVRGSNNLWGPWVSLCSTLRSSSKGL